MTSGEYSQLIEMYKEGAITGYQVMIQCLHMLDPQEPQLVLSHLPDEIHEEMLEYAKRYNPRRPRSDSPIPPAEDQVRSAERWIQEHRIKGSKPVKL